MKKGKPLILLLVILFLAAFLRFYKLDQVPPSLSWDEVAVGYNAWSIANFGKDEWGKSFPLVFHSFGDDKSPIHIYLTAVSTKFFGLNEFSTRLPSVIFGTLNILLIFYLGKILLKSQLIGLLAAFFMAVSPYCFQFSRFNHEAQIALFFFMLGLAFFYLGLSRGKFLPASFLSFGVSIFSYHSPKVVVPAVLITLIAFYLKELLKVKIFFLGGLILFILILSLVLLEPGLLGLSRAKQTNISGISVANTILFRSTHNQALGQGEIILLRYLSHFSPTYLFFSGDKNPKFSIQTFGQFYIIEAFFLLIGFFSLVIKKDREAFILLLWALLAPLPAAIFGGENEAPHAARAMFTMGSWQLISALGAYKIITLTKSLKFQISLTAIFILVLLIFFKNYLSSYFSDYPKRYAIEWQYGMKQAAQYSQTYEVFQNVYVTKVRSQPYIFFLYYLKIPPDQFLKTIKYNSGPDQSSNLVLAFDKYHFGDFNPIEAEPKRANLYILTASEYDGLRHKTQFEVLDRIKYLNETDAFFVVNGKN